MVAEQEQGQTNDERQGSRRAQGGAGRLKQFSIWHPRRARGFARTASETAIDMTHHWIVGRDLSFEHAPHEDDAAAGGLVLVANIHIGRACLQAETAMHAGIQSGCRTGKRGTWKGAA